MALVWQIRTLNAWLSAQGAQRGDLLVDRLTPNRRYVLLRSLPDPGYTTGQVLHALTDGHLDQLESVDDMTIPPGPDLRVVSGDLGPPAPRHRRRP